MASQRIERVRLSDSSGVSRGPKTYGESVSDEERDALRLLMNMYEEARTGDVILFDSWCTDYAFTENGSHESRTCSRARGNARTHERAGTRSWDLGETRRSGRRTRLDRRRRGERNHDESAIGESRLCRIYQVRVFPLCHAMNTTDSLLRSGIAKGETPPRRLAPETETPRVSKPCSSSCRVQRNASCAHSTRQPRRTCRLTTPSSPNHHQKIKKIIAPARTRT